MSPGADNLLRCGLKTGSIPLKIFILEHLKHLKALNCEHIKSFFSRSGPIILPQMQKSFPSVLSKKVSPVSLRMHSNPAQRKPAKHNRASCGRFQSNVWLLSRKGTIWRQRGDILASKKGLQLLKVFTPPVISHLV